MSYHSRLQNVWKHKTSKTEAAPSAWSSADGALAGIDAASPGSHIEENGSQAGNVRRSNSFR